MSDFSRRLIEWQKRHGRHDLPWQRDWERLRDPYRVWLSEIMLQQTQVATVIPYYERFTTSFPDLAALAAAPVEEIMGLWSGLGYYARARNLHRCAKIVMEHHGGKFPADAKTIAGLPGIGRSTANAIAVFCFGARLPILDGNVKRLLCRACHIEGFPGTAAVEKELWRLAEMLLPQKNVGTYIQAQMDLGATVCLRGSPACLTAPEKCPLSDICFARLEGRTHELPAKRPAKALPERELRVLLLRHGDSILLEQRPPTGIWGSLLSLPELPDGSDATAHAAKLGYRLTGLRELPPMKHSFTHFRLTLRPLLCDATPSAQAVCDGISMRWLEAEALAQAALPAPIRRLLESVFNLQGR